MDPITIATIALKLKENWKLIAGVIAVVVITIYMAGQLIYIAQLKKTIAEQQQDIQVIRLNLAGATEAIKHQNAAIDEWKKFSDKQTAEHLVRLSKAIADVSKLKVSTQTTIREIYINDNKTISELLSDAAAD